MALKKKTVITKARGKTTTELTLPTEKSVPKKSFLDYSYMLYGRKKIGKTSLAGCFPDCFFLMSEPGAENLKVYQRPIRNWKEFVGYLDLLDANPERFRTVVIDIGDPLYDWCLKYICDKEGIDHPSEIKDYGATWKAITQELNNQCSRLLPINSGRGLVVTSHEKSIEVDVAGSVTTLQRIIPTMEKHTMEFFNGKVDVIAFYTYKGKERILVIDGDERLEAGCRLKYNFKTTAGERVSVIRAGKTEEETYQNFENAFHNKQLKSGVIAAPVDSVVKKGGVVKKNVVRKKVK